MALFDFLTGGKNPAKAAMPYLEKIEPMEKEYYNPFIQRGNTAYKQYSPILGQMTSDPAAFLESLMAKYEPSKAYQTEREEALRAAGNTAAAGGMRGSLQDIENESRLSDALLGKDMQQWLQNVLNIQGGGLSGQQHLYDTGFGAAQNLTSDLANLYGTQGQLAFQGQSQKNQSLSDILSALTKIGGAGAGYYVGGLPGAYLGSKFF